MAGIYPKTFGENDTPEGVREAVAMLMPLLFAGDHQKLGILREQFAAATIVETELTGGGFFVTFSVPADAPRVAGFGFSGGDAWLQLDTSPEGAGCVVHTRDGTLELLEVYTYGDHPWTENTRLVSVSGVQTLLETILQTEKERVRFTMPADFFSDRNDRRD
jgi:hypothetical protein